MTHAILQSRSIQSNRSSVEGKLSQTHRHEGVFYEQKTNEAGGQVFRGPELQAFVSEHGRDPTDPGFSEAIGLQNHANLLRDAIAFPLRPAKDDPVVITDNYARYEVYLPKQ